MADETKENSKKKKIIAGILIGVSIVIIGLVCVFAGIPLIKLAGDPDAFREWVDSKGIAGPLMYMGLVVFQILVAFIPGEPLEIVAGYVFGTFRGTLFCLLAASVGSIIVILLVRRFGKPLLEIFFAKEKIEDLKFLKSSQKRIMIFMVLFIVPGTPKDLLCYYGGLTDIPLGLLIFVCTICRFPSIITSTVGGDALFAGDYGFAAAVFIITAIVSVAGILIYNKAKKK